MRPQPSTLLGFGAGRTRLVLMQFKALPCGVALHIASEIVHMAPGDRNVAQQLDLAASAHSSSAAMSAGSASEPFPA